LMVYNNFDFQQVMKNNKYQIDEKLFSFFAFASSF
jgi:hypothetical protein